MLGGPIQRDWSTLRRLDREQVEQARIMNDTQHVSYSTDGYAGQSTHYNSLDMPNLTCFVYRSGTDSAPVPPPIQPETG